MLLGILRGSDAHPVGVDADTQADHSLHAAEGRAFLDWPKELSSRSPLTSAGLSLASRLQAVAGRVLNCTTRFVA